MPRLPEDHPVYGDGPSQAGQPVDLAGEWEGRRVPLNGHAARHRVYPVWKLSAPRWKRVRPVLGTLLSRAQFVVVYYTWRPMSSDPGDEHVIDCAMNAGASVVTWNLRDYRSAQQELGLKVQTPVEALTSLAQEER